MAVIFGIESTCDETAAAVVVDGRDVRCNVVASQARMHAVYRGVVPEIASRAHLHNILPVLTTAAEQAGLGTGLAAIEQIDAISIAHRPGLIGSLLIGLTAAKTIAWATGKPLIGVDHVHAHLYSVMLDGGGAPRRPIELPAVGLVVSGGHTALYEIRDWLDVSLIGSTIDDAVGEAYDKVAAILGLGYPGGPILDSLAQGGDPRAVRFPRTLLGRESLDFSFSGIKTAVLYHVRGVPSREKPIDRTSPLKLSPAALSDIAASFQAACIDVLVEKLCRAARQIKARSIVVGGGVSANRGLRAALGRLALPVAVPALEFCTDNAAMSAGLADVLLGAGRVSDLSLDAITYSQFRADSTSRRQSGNVS